MNEENKNQNNQPASMAVRREGPDAGMMGGDIDVQVATAKRYPRSIGQAKQGALGMATIDQKTAAGCIYAIRRANKVIEGPGIRLAEIFAINWGNSRFATRTVGEDEGFTYAEARGWDLETNVAISCEVKRRITNKEGRRFSDDMVQVTANAAMSVALRNVIFKIIPRVYVQEVYLETRKAAAGGAKTLKKQRGEIFRFFEEKGVGEKQILDLLNVANLDDVTLDHIATLRGLQTSVKDGLVSAETIFRSSDKPDGAVPAEEKGLADEKGQAGEIDSEKERLLGQIRGELIRRWPGSSKESKDEKKAEIKIVFGRESWEKVKILPNHILAAGLKCIRERANGEDFFGQDGSVASGDDIPF